MADNKEKYQNQKNEHVDEKLDPESKAKDTNIYESNPKNADYKKAD
ncbi:hypothetical protein GCM10025879_03030 [Leuconostoc litchii]|nr:hypothetical protein [Leuconostoc litchii]GMA69057.1 hypothetical protein GCM10025879_03030 [Leuconostoc litchii]